MQQEYFMGTTKCGDKLLLDYYIIHEEVESGYGIRIFAHCPETLSGESTQIHGIYEERQQAEQLCKVLLENTVTPVTMRDVVEDYLAV